MLAIQDQLRGKLVVSCQAYPGDPLDDIDALRRIVRAVVASGAQALRLNSAEQIRIVRQDTKVPIIGIQKRYVDGILRITLPPPRNWPRPAHPLSRWTAPTAPSLLASLGSS